MLLDYAATAGVRSLSFEAVAADYQARYGMPALQDDDLQYARVVALGNQTRDADMAVAGAAQSRRCAQVHAHRPGLDVRWHGGLAHPRGCSSQWDRGSRSPATSTTGTGLPRSLITATSASTPSAPTATTDPSDCPTNARATESPSGRGRASRRWYRCTCRAWCGRWRAQQAGTRQRLPASTRTGP